MAEEGRLGWSALVNREFTTTHWSVVLAAAQTDSPQAAEALENLCRTYWYPLYAFVRRRGYSPEDAQDLTQGFLASLLSTHALGTVHPAKGRFRSFLLAALKKAVERLRRRYGELLREEIAHTVSDPAEVDEEIRYLRSVVGAR
jgi:DNA-directed RNA polymerase specialized sigma24 family protein